MNPLFIALAIAIGFISSGRLSPKYQENVSKQRYLSYAKGRVRIFGDDVSKCVEESHKDSLKGNVSIKGMVAFKDQAASFESVETDDSSGEVQACLDSLKRDYFPNISMVKIKEEHRNRVFHFYFNFTVSPEKAGQIEFKESSLSEQIW